jgi:hypothetical protein
MSNIQNAYHGDFEMIKVAFSSEIVRNASESQISTFKISHLLAN